MKGKREGMHGWSCRLYQMGEKRWKKLWEKQKREEMITDKQQNINETSTAFAEGCFPAIFFNLDVNRGLFLTWMPPDPPAFLNDFTAGTYSQVWLWVLMDFIQQPAKQTLHNNTVDYSIVAMESPGVTGTEQSTVPLIRGEWACLDYLMSFWNQNAPTSRYSSREQVRHA